MAKKKRKVKASKFGRYISLLTARPGEEPVLEPEEKAVVVKKPKKEKVKVKELKSAAEIINSAASSKPVNKVSSRDDESEEIDEEYAEEYSGVLKSIETHTSKWKKTGDTGLYVEPPVSWKDKVDKVVEKYRIRRREMDKKRWVKLEQIKSRPRKPLIRLPQLFKKKRRQWTKPSPKDVADVYEELLDRTKTLDKRSVGRDDIDNIYKQLKSK